MSYVPYQNQPFNPVAPSTRAVAELNKYLKTLLQLDLTFGGGLTKANLTEIMVKLGSRQIVGPISALELDCINLFRRFPVDAGRLTIDFTEREMFSRNYNAQIAHELGGIDMPSIGGDQMYVEIQNTLGAGAPTLNMREILGDLQQSPQNRDPNQMVIKKILTTTLPGTGSTRVVWTPQLRGAQLLRVHFRTATNNNIQVVECKKNNVPIWDRITAGDNAYMLQKFERVPQANTYHLDFTLDNLLESWVDTSDALSLEFNIDLNVVEPIRAIYEVIDLPYNL